MAKRRTLEVTLSSDDSSRPTGPTPPPASLRPGRRTLIFGFSAYDFANSAFATVILSVLFNQYYAGVVAGGAEGVDVFGRNVPGATVYSVFFSFSMLVVVLAGPFLGALSDRGAGRIRYLAAFWLPGTLLTAVLAWVGPGDWLWGGIVFALAYICFAASAIFYNALLPEVAPRHELGRISGIAWGVGYVGGALLLVLNLLMLQKPQVLGFAEGTFSIHACFASVAVWWFLFSLPALWIFRFEASEHRQRLLGRKLVKRSIWRESRESIREVRSTFRSLRRTRNFIRFLIAYLIYNDGVQTVVAMASIFGAQELGMTESELILFFLLIQVNAFLGSLGLGWLADRRGHKPALLLAVSVWASMTVWGYAIGIFGNPKLEYWILGSIAGLFLGGIQTCSRSLVTHWIPDRRESEFFGFFAVMTRIAAVIGPLVFGGLVALTGELRTAILSVAVFFIGGGAVLLTVDPRAIDEERARLASEARPLR